MYSGVFRPAVPILPAVELLVNQNNDGWNPEFDPPNDNGPPGGDGEPHGNGPPAPDQLDGNGPQEEELGGADPPNADDGGPPDGDGQIVLGEPLARDLPVGPDPDTFRQIRRIGLMTTAAGHLHRTAFTNRLNV